MKQVKYAEIFGTGLRRIMIIGLITYWFVIGLYVYKFAPGNWFELSSSKEVWANFGDYFGGVLNPVFSFMAFTGVLFTVLLQAKQLDIARDHAEFEEMQRVLATISAQIDSQLAQIPTYHESKGFLRPGAPLTLFEHIAAFGTDILAPTQLSELERGYYKKETDAMKRDIQAGVQAVSLHLHRLCWCLMKYQEKGGSDTVVGFYKFQYSAVVCWLDAIGSLGSTSRARQVFDIEALKADMSDLSGPF